MGNQTNLDLGGRRFMGVPSAALDGIREECAKLIGAGKRIVLR